MAIFDKLKTTFRAFKYRNYRLFFTGQLISLIGTWIEVVAINWLIYELTSSALAMGIISFVTALPTFFAPFSGVIVDRYDKYKMLKLIQFFFMAQALTMAYLTITGQIQVWHIVVLGLFLNLIVAVDMPLRQAIVIELVDDSNDLSNAISLNSSCFNLARLIGPAIGGILVAMFGVGICFLINALSFIPVVIAVSLMKGKNAIGHIIKESVLIELKEGFSYVKKTPAISNLILYLAILSFIGMTYPLLMPILTKDIYLSDARLLGYFMSSAGIGALLGSLLLAYKKTTKNLPKFLIISAFVLSCALFILGFVKIKILSAILLFIIGLSMVSSLVIINTLVQYLSDDDKRGRVMSLHTLAFIGTIPFGNLLTGVVAQHIGVLKTFNLYGLIIFIFAVLFTRRILKANYNKD